VIFLLIVISVQVFVTTVVKNDFVLEYFDATKIVSRVDEKIASATQAVFLGDDDDRYHDAEDDFFDIRDRYDEDEDEPVRIDVRTTGKRKENNEKPRKRNNESSKSNNNQKKKKKNSERQRVVILGGPHKTASTTLQDFFSNLAHETVQLNEKSTTDKWYEPHRINPDWAFPVGIPEEYTEGPTMISGTPMKRPTNIDKFHAILASLISGRRLNMYFPGWRPDDPRDEVDFDVVLRDRGKVRDYFRALFAKPWKEGKNLLLAAEAFDTLVERLVIQENDDRKGVDLHVSDDSGLMIDQLMRILPFDDDDDERSLRLEDIEVHLNFRSPRIKHLISIWHQKGSMYTLRYFMRNLGVLNMYQINTLGLALQFLRRGIRVTVVDMLGVREKETREEEAAAAASRDGGDGDITVIGGLQGVVGCEILRMDDLCDDTSRMHLPGFPRKVDPLNVKEDKHGQNMSEDQLTRMGRLLDAYDCGVWRHLRRYRDEGLLRILHPSEHLFETCSDDDVDNNEDELSFRDVLKQLTEIAKEDNGIPLDDYENEFEDKKVNHKAKWFKRKVKKIKRQKLKYGKRYNGEYDDDETVMMKQLEVEYAERNVGINWDQNRNQKAYNILNRMVYLED